MEITKKITTEFFDLVNSGKKKFEIRLGDWECKEGDILILKEWNEEKKAYTGREIKKKVTYVFNTKDVKFFDKKEVDKYGFNIISIE